MNRRVMILQLGQVESNNNQDSKYWIGTDPNHARIQYGGQPIVMGRVCSSLAELEAVAAEIREELGRVLAEARQKFGSVPK
jgi:hypothetical protein